MTAEIAAGVDGSSHTTTDVSSPTSRGTEDQFREVFAGLVQAMKEQGMTPQELLEMYGGSSKHPPNNSVPLEIFALDLSPSEALCKYLKELLHLSYKEIANLINRDERSIWTSYMRALKKMPKRFPIDAFWKSKSIPLEIFADRRLSILENVVIYLRENTDFTNYRIAKVLNKTPSMIYTIYNRAKKKLAEGGEHK